MVSVEKFFAMVAQSPPPLSARIAWSAWALAAAFSASVAVVSPVARVGADTIIHRCRSSVWVAASFCLAAMSSALTACPFCWARSSMTVPSVSWFTDRLTTCEDSCESVEIRALASVAHSWPEESSVRVRLVW